MVLNTILGDMINTHYGVKIVKNDKKRITNYILVMFRGYYIGGLILHRSKPPCMFAVKSKDLWNRYISIYASLLL
jgi:hypothetical protein